MNNYLNIINQIGYFYETVSSADDDEWTFFLKDKKWQILLNKEPLIYIDKNEIYDFIKEHKINEDSFNHYLYSCLIDSGMYYEIYEPNNIIYYMIQKEIGRDIIVKSIEEMKFIFKSMIEDVFKPEFKLIKNTIL